jgi:hypothetical protein
VLALLCAAWQTSLKIHTGQGAATMTTPKTDALMALADRYAFHIPGSQHSDEARDALLAALQEQAREGEVEQEPIARIMFNDDGRKTDNLIDCDLPVGTLLYAAPQGAPK